MVNLYIQKIPNILIKYEIKVQEKRKEKGKEELVALLKGVKTGFLYMVAVRIKLYKIKF